MEEQQHPRILRPQPRRPFDTPIPSNLATPRADGSGETESDDVPSRTKSLLNLTSSTLFGIYSPSEYDTARDSAVPTPWGTGAQTPRSDGNEKPFPIMTTGPDGRPILKRMQSHQKQSVLAVAMRLTLRITALFVLGVAYGMVISQLHENQHIAPVKMQNIHPTHPAYLVFWGFAGVGLGSLLPWVDRAWLERFGQEEQTSGRDAMRVSSNEKSHGTERDIETLDRRESTVLGADWYSMVRSVGAFVGIAFAIRKLPWQSTLQVSLTLALVNPALWYLIDRTTTGFVLSGMVGLIGTSVLLIVNPKVVPSPAPEHTLSNFTSSVPTFGNEHGDQLLGGVLSYESLGVAVWLASVLFCSCVCFGNIGRRLALLERSR